MSTDARNIADLEHSILPGQAVEVHKTGIPGLEELIVSQSIDAGNLRRLLEALVREDCVHSWRNFGPNGTFEDLLQWENRLRPTELFFFYLKFAGKIRLVGAGAVADRLTKDFPHPGFCVLGRCCIMPEFRSLGLYRQILHYRLEYCRRQFGNQLNAIHIGSVSERISSVITNHQLSSWSNFVHLGEEELKVAGEVRTVGAYLLLLPEYVRRIKSVLDGADAAPCVVQLRNALSDIESGHLRNLGTLAKESFEKACVHGWFHDRNPLEIEQLLLFCSSIPLVGFSRDAR